MSAQPEPWLRGTHSEVAPVPRQVLHALELTREDCLGWCEQLTDAEIKARTFGLAPVAFHMRHIARSLDRLLSYAEGRELDAGQFTALRSELEGDASVEAVTAEFVAALEDSARRIRAFSPGEFEEVRHVGRGRLPSTVAGLLIHCAEHTQRHTGQVVTTAKLLLGLRGPADAGRRAPVQPEAL